MTQREQDRITSLIWLAAGLAISYGALRLSLGSLHQPGPGFFAFLSGAVLTILSFVVFWGTRKRSSEANEADVPLWQNKQRARKVGYTLITAVLYAIGMNYIGFALSTLLFLGIILRFVDPQPWRTVLICSVLGSAGSWFIFKYWLDVQLPGGIIGY
jgi:putative tricarboxylic transport membrane protein